MRADRFGAGRDSPEPERSEERGEGRSDYDFHAFRLNTMDVVWAWALVAGVLLLPALIL